MANLNLNPEKTALLAMDFHRGVVAACQMAAERGLEDKAQTALDTARKAGIKVLHVELAFFPAYSSQRNKFQRIIRERMPAGSPQEMAERMKVLERLAPQEGEAVVHKPKINAFYGSPLDALLRAKDIDTLLLMGVTTENVVEATARQAADSDYRVFVLEDACAAFNVQDHENSISYMHRIADIVSVSDLTESV